MAFKKFSLFEDKEDEVKDADEEYYAVSEEEAKNSSDSNKVILVEPRAYSESQTITDHLKARNSVLVNFKRVTKDQQRRILDFLSGTLYAIGGDLQKVGDGIFLCTPKNIPVEGEISDEKDKDDSDNW